MFHVTSLALCRNAAFLAVVYCVNFIPPLNCAPLNKTLDSAADRRNSHQNPILVGSNVHNKTVIDSVAARPPANKDDEAVLPKAQLKDIESKEHKNSPFGPQQLRPIAAGHAKDLHFVTEFHLRSSSAKSHIVPLKLDEIQPPEHVDGLRMEQNGRLNADYKKEIFLGNHEEFDHGSNEKKLLSRLKIVFLRADTNHDGLLTHEELKAWIMLKVREHLHEADAENVNVFRHLDTDNDGSVAWKEFQLHFLLAKGHMQNETQKHVEDFETSNIDHEDRERLIRYKFRWAEADTEPQDDLLSIEEMKNFRHPEQSSKMLVRMALDLIENLDSNDDKIITEEEFVSLPAHDLDEMAHERSVDEVWQNERRKEFRNVIDVNHDGKVDVEELKLYVDPDNENHAHLEADNLIQLADLNSDGKLSIHEVLESAELFLGSKMVDTGRNFHDEF